MCGFDDFFGDGFGDLEGFALIGGAIGFIEDQFEEEEEHDRIMEVGDPYDDLAP